MSFWDFVCGSPIVAMFIAWMLFDTVRDVLVAFAKRGGKERGKS